MSLHREYHQHMIFSDEGNNCHVMIGWKSSVAPNLHDIYDRVSCHIAISGKSIACLNKLRGGSLLWN